MTIAEIPVLPYCGAPPDPTAIWTTWRLDPLVLGLLFVCWALYLARNYRVAVKDSATRRRGIAFGIGWLVATLALVSPLCPLSVALFAARAAQHVALTAIAAPLLAFGLGIPSQADDAARPRGLLLRSNRHPLAAAALFTVLIWTWHMPVPYAATFSSVAVYWTMHVSLLASSIWLWSCLLHANRVGLVVGLLAGTVSALQMGLLGALITLAPRPFYAPHFLTTDAWGLTPLQDQQLGGAIMWVVGGSVFFVAAMWGLARCLSERAPVLHGDATARSLSAESA